MKNNLNFQYLLNCLEELGFKQSFKDGTIIKIDWLVNQSDKVYDEVEKILFMLNVNPKKRYIFDV